MTAPRFTISIFAAILSGAALAWAGTGGESNYGALESSADREIIRRQEDAVVAEAKLQQGDAKLKAGDVEGAYQAYKEAVDLAADGDPTKGLRSRALSRYSSTAVRYAEYLVSQGEYAKAETVAREVLEPRYNPDYRPAAVFLSNLEKPDYFNKTITPEFAEDRSKVDQLLIEANGFYDSARYDMAMKRYQQVLSIDKYNAAALRGIEQVELGKQRYYDSAYNDTRSRMLWEVDKAWERPKRKFVEARTTESTALQEEKRGTEMMLAKLNRIIVPRIDFKDATVRQAITFLQQKSRDLDSGETDAERRGVNIVLKLPTTPAAPVPTAIEGADPAAAAAVPAGDSRINLSLTNVPLYEALRYVATLAGLKVKVEPFAVSIVPLSEPTETLEQREFKVPPGFIPNNAIASTAKETATAGRTEVPVTGQSRLTARQGARQFLESQGVEFPPGASANFIAGSSKLVVRNTPANLDLIEQLVDVAMRDLPTQVEIESKFVEVSQNNLKELGFDWALGPFSVPGSDAVFGSGGTAINSPAGTWPFVNPATDAAVGTDTITSGLRSGSGLRPGSAVSVNSIDALLSQSVTGRDLTAPAPGIFSISGVFTNPQFQLVIRALNQKKGVDLMACPKVTTKSGQKARIQITREFPYPETFTPPDVPNTVGSNNNNNLVGQAQADPIVTPAFPETMATRELGVILEVDPVIGPDGYTIDLSLSPQVVDFDGFVNYGSPIYLVRNRLIGQVIDDTIPGLPILRNLFAVDRSLMTENVINQPIFSVRKVTTNVSIWDGQTVALGGLIREDIQKVNDKVPLLGDIPLAGVAFRSEVDQKIKKNLIVFVTARLMDAAGQPLRPEDDVDQEEIVEPLGLPKDLKKPSMSAKGFRQK